MAERRIVVCDNGQESHNSIHALNRWCTMPSVILGLSIAPLDAEGILICGAIRAVEGVYGLCIASPSTPHSHPGEKPDPVNTQVMALHLPENLVNKTGRGYRLKGKGR